MAIEGANRAIAMILGLPAVINHSSIVADIPRFSSVEIIFFNRVAIANNS